MEQGKYGVKLNWMTQQLEEPVHTETGVKFVGLGNWLVEFPSSYQTMYFVNDKRGLQAEPEGIDKLFWPVIKGPIRARSADGLEMSVSMSFQWKLADSNLVGLYEILGDDLYKDEFVRFAKGAVIHACSFFAAEQYFSSRENITTKMMTIVSEAFQKPNRGLAIEIKGLQLREVDLPDEYDMEIAETQEQMQEYFVAEAERAQLIVKKEAEVSVAQERVKEQVANAEAIAEQIRLQNNAAIEQILLIQRKQADANAELLQQFVNDSQPFQRLFDLMQIKALEGHDAAAMTISM
jgi:regulator of protease activity HflC (stomatin/prohibitin superfamily)